MAKESGETKPTAETAGVAEAKKPRPSWGPALALAGLLVVLTGLAIVFFTGGEREKARRLTEVGEARTPAAAAPEAAAPSGRRSVTLYFLSDADDLLHGESREIATGPSAAEEAERALIELVKGSTAGLVSPLPPETRVRQVFITKDGTAYVDFGREIMEKFSYGSSSELAAVYAVVDTVADNFKGVKRVAILVEGAEKETLGGHIDLSQAFLPDHSVVAK